MNTKDDFKDYINKNYSTIAKILRGGLFTIYDPNSTPYVLSTIYEKCRINENDDINEIVFKSFVLNGNVMNTTNYINNLGYKTDKNCLFISNDISNIIFYKTSKDRDISIIAKSIYSYTCKSNILKWQIDKLINKGYLGEYKEEQQNYYNDLSKIVITPMTYLLDAFKNNDCTKLHIGFHKYCSDIIKTLISTEKFEQYRTSLLNGFAKEYNISYQVHYIEEKNNNEVRMYEDEAYNIYYETTKIKAYFEKIIMTQMNIIISYDTNTHEEPATIYFVRINGNYYFLHQQTDILNKFIDL